MILFHYGESWNLLRADQRLIFAKSWPRASRYQQGHQDLFILRSDLPSQVFIRRKVPLLSHVAGFISIERFQSLATEGKMLSLSWWENEYAVLQWKNHVLHAKAQQEGRESIFDFYKISIAHITREYSFKKDKDNV